MLPGDEVLYLKRGEDVGFGKAAVFAAAFRPLGDCPPGGFVHPWRLTGR
jgi:hypothetical protein